MGAQPYNSWMQPKLFSELTGADDEYEDLESVIAEGLRAMEEAARNPKAPMQRGGSRRSLAAVPDEIAAPMPEGQFRITRPAYQQFLGHCQNGDMTYVRLKHPERHDAANVILFGAQFDEHFPIKNLYKALNVVKPDCLLLQLRPDTINEDFTLDACADYDALIESTRRSGHTLYPSLEYRDEIKDQLKKNRIIVADGALGQESAETSTDGFIPENLETISRMRSAAVTTAGIWHENNVHRCDLHLGEIPLELHKNKIMNSMHLTELEEVFKEIAYDAAEHENLYEGALSACPDMMLHHSDEYMAALINQLSLRAEYRNIFVMCGYGQSRTIPYHLFHNPRAF